MSTTPHLYGSHSPVSHPTVRLLIQGEFVDSRSTELHPIVNPATQEVLCEVPAATAEEMESAIQSAREAFLEWRETPVSERARVMLRYQHLLKEHHDEIAEVLAKETGKVFADASGMSFDGLKSGYGFGIRGHGPTGMVMRFDFAKSNEGFILHIGSGPSF